MIHGADDPGIALPGQQSPDCLCRSFFPFGIDLLWNRSKSWLYAQKLRGVLKSARKTTNIDRRITLFAVSDHQKGALY